MTQQTTNETTELNAAMDAFQDVPESASLTVKAWMRAARAAFTAGWQARAALPPTSGEPLPRPAYDWCPECHARDSMPEPAAPAAPVADTGAAYQDCCDTPHLCSAVRRCTAKDSAPASPAPTADSAPRWPVLESESKQALTSQSSPSGQQLRATADSAADARCEYIKRKHVMGSSYGGITSLNIIVQGDDYAVGGALYAIDCMVEREQGGSVAAMSTNTGEGEG